MYFEKIFPPCEMLIKIKATNTIVKCYERDPTTQDIHIELFGKILLHEDEYEIIKEMNYE